MSILALSNQEIIFFGLTFSLLEATFFPLLITFANSLDPDQGQQNVSPDLNFGFEKKKISRRQQKQKILPSMQQVNVTHITRTLTLGNCV